MRRFLPFFLIFACGCAGQDQYSLEKEYWILGRAAQKIIDTPTVASMFEVERMADRLDEFVGKRQGTGAAVSAEFTAARLFIAKEEHDKARARLEVIAGKYASPEIRAEAFFLSGTTFQDGNWSEAMRHFTRVMEEFPLTKRGLGLPLYIAECHRKRFEPGLMVRAYNDAIGRYTRLASANPGTVYAFEAMLMASTCRGGLNDWAGAVKILEGLVAEYGEKAEMDGILLNIALIYRNELNDPLSCRKALERLVREYPQSKLINTARALRASEEGGSDE